MLSTHSLALALLVPGLAGPTLSPSMVDLVVQEAYLKASNTGSFDRFGSSVAMSGETLVVGAWGEQSGVPGDESDNNSFAAGAAYVFVRSGGSWVQQAYLKASNPNGDDRFGASLAISGDTIVIGASGEKSNATGVNGDQTDNSSVRAGAAYVFVRSGTTWTQQAYLKASNTDTEDNFGSTVAISGDTVVVGALREDGGSTGVNGDDSDNSTFSAGAAYVFVRSGTDWSQQAYLKASNTGAGDGFGSSVAISGETLVVGARWEDSNATGVDGDQENHLAGDSGAAYVFVRDGTSWSQQAYLKASNTSGSDEFGYTIEIEADTVVVAAFYEGSGATGVDGDEGSAPPEPDSGAAYVFTRGGTTWRQQAYLKASNTEEDDGFGSGIAVSGDTVVVTARGEDSGSGGVDGDQEDNNASNAGAAYVFTRTGSTWSQAAYVKASNPDQNDRFGSPSVQGSTLAVGAFGEGSNATGVNGDQTDNSLNNAGAAYVFDLDAPATSIGTPYCGPAVPNSTGSPGVIAATGSTDAGDEDVRLLASSLPPGNVCLFISSANQGLIQPPQSCGPICLMGPDIARFRFDAQQIGPDGQCAITIDPFIVYTNPPQPILAGQSWNFQAWHRDADAGPDCNNNFTDAVEIAFQ